ncbi:MULTISPECIES: hypothetical protein [unclassified Microbacterium]|uniref:hypothetical protein n=1 Tax=unclassified Microbacterium TaxID=2609290 RepID=UPI002468B25D|nr:MULTISPECIES: hypothetical protein [unclassified Microbacterium]MDH5133631.1 hypothetical protein [Microbacterium sp. RD10]MDH5137874.1 hypothetical protein [Microbacterium sp. RD11]MDH5145526.1 hypothetical protein [Microbacterium sp. RD12]MDH5156142.1 hypothetical protein [Microbacterium sp. RD06]MDH5166370.1 hypothetical protein [Microbacterium sp. RD02]
MNDYTPTTEEVLEHWSATRGSAIDPEAAKRKAERERMFRRWLAAHDAEKRAEWEAEEPELEYGVTSKWGIQETPTLHGANQYASHLRRSIESGRESGDLDYHGRVMRRTKAKAGPWMPVKQEGTQT